MEKEDITTEATLLGILPGDPPSILIGKRLSRSGKPGRWKAHSGGGNLTYRGGSVQHSPTFLWLVARMISAVP